MSFLHHLFDRFLHTRHVTRHFARRLILDTLTLGRAPTPATSPDLLSRELQRAASDELPALIERLQSDPAGLSDAQAAAALAQHGPTTRWSTKSRCPPGCTCGTATGTLSTCCSRCWH